LIAVIFYQFLRSFIQVESLCFIYGFNAVLMVYHEQAVNNFIENSQELVFTPFD